MKYERLTSKLLADWHKEDLEKNGIKAHELSAVYEKLRTENLGSNHDYRALLYIRLAELEDKIENGTLVEWPCKIGDTVYEIVYDIIDGIYVRVITESTVENITIDSKGMCVETEYAISYLQDKDNTIFLTKEEAEARLNELQEINQ